ncbi:hypothetical protein ACIRP0_27575 [Streptomyces sp. NPDC101733]|uniref:hypothetical protein n=1 Tax=unclassified Streptomyces TaxID=2593676 RepID=UPI0038047DDD
MHLTMAAIALTATPQAPHRHIDANVLTDVLWACAHPADRPEHLTALTEDGRAELVVYVLADSEQAARTAALHGVRRALDTCPLLSGWTAREILLDLHAALDVQDPSGPTDLEIPQ